MMAISRKLMLGAISKELAAKYLKDRGRELAEAIRGALPEGYFYVLALRDGDDVAYFSDSELDQAIDMLEKVLGQLKERRTRRTVPPTPIGVKKVRTS
jgi:hypothetical protein